MYVPRSNIFAVGLLSLGAVFALGCSTSNGNESCTTCSVPLSEIGGTSHAGTTSTDQLARTGGTMATSGGEAASGGATPTGGAKSSGGTSGNGGASASAGSTSTAGTAGSGTWPASCVTVTGAVAKDLVARGALLLDVRTASEFDSGALPGAVNIPVTDIDSRLSELDINRPIVVYCASGTRAGQALTNLCGKGYSVYSLGAISNWPQ